MKFRNSSLDLRLAIPVLVGWLSLVVILLNFEATNIGEYLGIIFVALLLCGIIFTRKLPIVGMSALISSALVFSLLVQLPLYELTNPWDLPQDEDVPVWLSWSTIIREAFLHSSDVLPDFGGQLVPGLAIGDTSRVSEYLSESMKAVSLTHITAVSGANCAIVTACVMAIAALCGAGRKLRSLLAVIALIAFVVLVTPQPSVVRAALMAIIVIFSLMSGRPGAGVPLLSIAVTLILIWNPWWSIDFGFILSVAATTGLLIFSVPITHRLSRFLPEWLAVLIALPLAAQLMCQPFIILLSPQIPTYGVLANVIAAPAAPLATIFGLVACLLVLWAPLLAQVFLWIAWLPAEWIAHTSLAISRFPHAQLPWIEGVAGSALAALLSCLILVALLSTSQVVRRVIAVGLTLSLCSWLLYGAIAALRFSTSLPQEWSVAACDVGQGDALVLRSKGKVALIDVGRRPEKISHCLEQLQIATIDLLVLTHFDKDHVGGLGAVMGKVDRAVVGKPENAEDQALLSDLTRSGTTLEQGNQGLSGVLGEAKWLVLWPDGMHPSMDMGNPGSVTLLVTFPGFTALFLGDLGKESQLALMSSVNLPSVQVVKVAHHGSADQSSSFYEELSPAIGIYSVGSENDYGHPRQEALDMLANLGALTPRTDTDGLILVSSTTSGLSVWTEH